MKFVADLHLHSKYSRAVSQEMVLEKMAQWAKYKGIGVLATGDFTHPFWFEKLKNELEDCGNGLFRLKPETTNPPFGSKLAQGEQSQIPNKEETYFLLSCEISSIYSQGGKGRRIHNLFFFPSLASVEKFNAQLIKRGANLRSDGRPIVGISSRDLAEIALTASEKALIIPAHAWTPWFSIFGSFSGFDSIEECFGDMAPNIYAVETGLSSDPAMNWQIADLEKRSILSFSDAHSLPKMGREATVFEAEEISYENIYKAIKGEKEAKIAFTIEFHPEEGKYHFTGHRDCNWSQGPEKANEKICPVCNRPLTVGVMDRVEELKSQNPNSKIQIIDDVRWVRSEVDKRSPYVSLVPLYEIISEVLAQGISSKAVTDCYFTLVTNLGSEFNILLKAKLSEIAKFAPPRVAEGIEKVRSGDVVVEPGYDGKFGVVQIWSSSQSDHDNPKESEVNKQDGSQLNLFASR